MKLHIAYIAGMLDADGTITASIVKTNDLSKNPSFLVGANICGQNLSVLMSIQETLECGNIRAYRSGHSGCYRYTIPRRHMTRVLPMLIPYLQVKREQAELALKGVSLKTHGGYHFKPPAQIFSLRQSIARRISELNKHDGKVYRKNWVNSVKRSSFVTKYESIPSQAVEGVVGSTEGVTTSRVSPNNNPGHESPARKGRDSLTTTVM